MIFESAHSMTAPDVCLKLYNDKVTLSRYVQPKPKFKQLDKWHKVYLPTGELCRHTFEDSQRYLKNHGISVNRSLRNLKEIGEKNAFAYFVTITFNRKWVKRDDAEAVYKSFKNIIKRFKYHYGQIQYVGVPEYHADEKNIHVHMPITFERKPKLHRYARYHGRDLFYIVDKFKREDCTIVVEKLNGQNNINYCIKYMTKTSSSPFARRYLASRNLNRSRLQANIHLAGQSHESLQALAKQMGFSTVFKSPDGLYSLKYETEAESEGAEGETQTRGPAARLHLSTINTMDEKVEKTFWEFLQRIANSAAMRDKIREIRQRAAEIAKNAENAKKVVCEQLAFDMEI